MDTEREWDERGNPPPSDFGRTSKLKKKVNI
jgi:hypothetical protein